MRFFATVSALSAVALVAAQNPVIVQVGSTQNAQGGIFQFIPNNLTGLTNGTVVTFQYTGAPGNHSITQSTLTAPCTPMSGGFDSGWVSIPASNASQTPEWNLTITNDQKPIWFFCKQLVPLTHCSAGMVGAINAPTSGNATFEDYLNNAKAFSGPSGQGEGNLVGVGASASAGPGPIPSGVTAYAVPSATSPGSPSGSAAGSGSASPTGSPAPNGASGLTSNTLLAILGAAFGVAFA